MGSLLCERPLSSTTVLRLLKRNVRETMFGMDQMTGTIEIAKSHDDARSRRIIKHIHKKNVATLAPHPEFNIRRPTPTFLIVRVFMVRTCSSSVQVILSLALLFLEPEESRSAPLRCTRPIPEVQCDLVV